jgi:hypothetical protein
MPENLLDYEVKPGLKLRDATKEDLVEAICRLTKQGKKFKVYALKLERAAKR